MRMHFRTFVALRASIAFITCAGCPRAVKEAVLRAQIAPQGQVLQGPSQRREAR